MKEYKRFTTEQLIEYTKAFHFTRKVKEFHIHHTWKPSYDNFTGNHNALQWGMERYHVQDNGWSTIGQHLTLFPDGVWLLGRDFNKVPASILGWNTYALAVEMVGNFDRGYDHMSPHQKVSILAYTNFVVEQLHWVPKFHRDSPTSYKTCPGSGIDRDTFFLEVSNYSKDKILEAEAKEKAKELKKIMEETNIIFKDMVKDGKVHYANDYINNLASRNVVKGYLDGNFRPDDKITRADAAIIVVKAIESIEEKITGLMTALAKAGIDING